MGTEKSLARFNGQTDLVPFRKPHKRTFDPKDSLATLEKYSQDQLDDKTFLDPRTSTRRDGIWANWIEFAKSIEADAEETWIQFCIGSRRAQNIFRAFLRQYVISSTTLRPCLGPEEYMEVRTIDSATTVEDIWCMLVNEADYRVMTPKRLEDRQKASFWSLKYASNKQGNGCGPAYEIGRWIPLLADEIDLLKTQGFEKSAMQSEDIISALDILWTEAKHIPCRPSTRLAFHTATVLGGLGGWRPGSLVNIKYKDVQFAWVRDPKLRTRTWPVVYTTIHHVKQKNRVEREQRSYLRFPMTVIPFKLLCLVTLFTARAIADDAFLADFDSCDKVLNPEPIEEGGIDFVELKWKDKMMDEYIVPITYKAFLDIWNRVHLVAGTREKKRPYTMRVGTANRLNGSLERAMCNFILSHSTDVFERSYQSVQIAEKLAEIAYGEKAKQDEHLWSAVSNASNAFLKRDPNAPLYLTQEELDNFETRNDLKDLREQLKLAKQQGGASCRKPKDAIWARIRYIIGCLETLKLQEKRSHYFAEVDRLRALGQSTTHLQDPSAINPRRKAFQASSAVAAKIAPLLTDEEPPAALPDRIVAYLTERQFQDGDDGDDKPEPDEACGQPRCLFGCGDFANRSALTRHVRKIHMDIFKHPFPCPECKHLGWGECTIEGNPGAWSSHVERKHGKLHAPNLQSGTIRQAYCLLCEDYFTERGFVQHLNSRHPVSKFCQPFRCPECRRQDKDDSTITDRDAWIAHVREIHEGGEVWGAVIVKDEDMGESIARFKASGNQQRKRHGDSSHGLPLDSARPRKRNCLEQRSISDDWDWKDEDIPDPHAQEEFWVDGRD